MVGFYDGALDRTRDSIIEGSTLGLSLRSTVCEVIGSDECIILGSTVGEIL